MESRTWRYAKDLFEAHDTRLRRTVAIKILRAAPHKADPYRRRRFEREAQAVAALAHPHICVLYDVGHHEGIDFLVMSTWTGRRLQTGCCMVRSRSMTCSVARSRPLTRSTRPTEQASFIVI